MKTLKLFVCATLLLLSACVDFEEEGPDVSGIDTGAYLTAVKMTEPKEMMWLSVQIFPGTYNRC